MTGSGFDKDRAWSVFESLRPEAGLTLDHLAVATYSLDMVAVAALMLSLGAGREDELLAGPLDFADAVRTLKSRVVILHQKGRMKPPTRHREVLHMLDGAIRAVTPEPTASWHPKVMLGRYVDARGIPSWRLWFGSRNLTGGRDREAGLTLIGSLAKTERPEGVGAVLRSLVGDAGWSAEQLSELGRLRWQSPEGARIVSLRFRSLGASGALVIPPAKVRKTLVISPFVDAAGLKTLSNSGELKLLTTATEAAFLSDLDGWCVRVAGATAPDEEPMAIPETGDDGAPAPLPAHSLHAKLVLFRTERTNRLWIGSANATRRGLSGPNAELMAELDIADVHADALEQYWTLSQESGSPVEVDPDVAEREAAERRLDDALCEVLAAEFRIDKTDAGLVLSTTTDLDGFLASHDLEVGLMSLERRLTWPRRARSVVIAGPETPLRLQTVLVSFRVRTTVAPFVERSWAQPVEFPEFDAEARDRVALAAYIGPARFAAWLRAQLEGFDAVDGGSTTWTGDRKPPRPGDSPGSPTRPFTLEVLLGSWARNPDAFEKRVREVDGVLRAFVEDLPNGDAKTIGETEAMLRDVMPFWLELRASLGMGDSDGA